MAGRDDSATAELRARAEAAEQRLAELTEAARKANAAVEQTGDVGAHLGLGIVLDRQAREVAPTPPHEPRCPDSENCWTCCSGVYKNRKRPPPDPQPAALTAEQVVAYVERNLLPPFVKREDYRSESDKVTDRNAAIAVVERYAQQQVAAAGMLDAYLANSDAKAAHQRIVDLERQLAEAQQRAETAERRLGFSRDAVAKWQRDHAAAEQRAAAGERVRRAALLVDHIRSERINLVGAAYADWVQRWNGALNALRQALAAAPVEPVPSGEGELQAHVVLLRLRRDMGGMELLEQYVRQQVNRALERDLLQRCSAEMAAEHTAPVEPGGEVGGAEREVVRLNGELLQSRRDCEATVELWERAQECADARGHQLAALEGERDSLRRELEAARAAMGRQHERNARYVAALHAIQQHTQQQASAALSSLQPSGRGGGGGHG